MIFLDFLFMQWLLIPKKKEKKSFSNVLFC